MKISSIIKDNRVKHKLTQEELAELTYVSKKTISNWENDKTSPDIDSLIKLSEIFELSLDDMIKGNSEVIEQLKKDTNTIKSNKLTLYFLSGFAIFYLLIYILFSQGRLHQTTDTFINYLLLITISGGLLWRIVKYIEKWVDIKQLTNIILLVVSGVIIFSIISFMELEIHIAWQMSIIKIIGTFIVGAIGYELFVKKNS
ncbi:helix-turn-helix domain-containing protein [Streptococcus uberis]|uniref:helix-turn-helix domain-containing protein n=1 Tax=Streptococcus uberis TaxID=1349 RepID=UPI001939BBFF|nr:helix-turn-helix transcriptional regulator [Streptococcus uberis]